MRNREVAIPYRLVAALLALFLVPVGLLGLRVIDTDSYRYGFLVWNLVLAAIPPLLAWWLVWRIRHFGWSPWPQVVLTIAWVLFLPNSFYLITDLIHLRSNYEADLLFDISLLVAAIFAGVTYGFIGVYMVHMEILKRLRESHAYLIISALLLAVSFAICLGRYTRWNTWDVLLRPAGLLFDVSDRFINPHMHEQTYLTTFILFITLFAVYVLIFEAARLLRSTSSK